MAQTPFKTDKFMAGLGQGLIIFLLLCLILAGVAWMNAQKIHADRIAKIPFEMLIVMPLPKDMPKIDEHEPSEELSDNTSQQHIEPSSSSQAQHQEDEHTEDDHNAEVHSKTENIHNPTHITPTDHDAGAHAISLAVPDFIEESDYGPLPKKSTTGERPFDVYKTTFRIPPGKKPLSIVIAPLGMNKELASNVIQKLPDFVTLAFTPYMHNAAELFQETKAQNKEPWLLLPLEQENPLTNDNGHFSMRADFSFEKNKENFHRVLSSAEAYPGIMILNADTSTLSFGSARNSNIIHEIEERGLALAYSSTLPVREINASFVQDSVLHIPMSSDETFNMIKSKIEAQLDIKDSLTIILHPYPSQLDSINQWLHTLPEKGYILAPLSTQITIQEERAQQEKE